jgi:hypothetical protein
MMIVVWLFIALAGGVIFAMILYFREKHSAIPSKQRLFLALLRGISVFLVILLLSSLMLNTKQTIQEKPIFAIISDNSRSMILSRDSAFLATEFPDELQILIQNLRQKADVYQYEFDSEFRNSISYEFDGEQTDIASVLQNIIQRYEGRNIAGMLLITDGIVNTGNDPAMMADKLLFPVHTIAVGDTTSFSDIAIKSIRYNPTVGFGNRFPVEVVIHGTKMRGKKTQLRVKQDGKELYNETVQFNSDVFSETRTFIFEANQKGLTRIEVLAESQQEERNKSNNSATAIIQVIDKKNKVAIVFHSPHPDITAIKSALDDARNYETELITSQTFNFNKIQDFDAVVLFQLPDPRVRTVALDQIISSKTPYLLIIGSNTDLRQLAAIQAGIKIQQNMPSLQEALPSLNSGFSMFQISPELQRNIRLFPPLLTHFGNYSLSDDYQVFMYQKIGSIQTSNPMIAFSAGRDKTSAIITGEGLYKWKFYDYLNNENHQSFNEIIQKTMNILVQHADKRRLRIHHKDVYFTTENTELTAEVYNLAMEMIVSPEIRMNISHNNDIERDFMFSPQITDYRLNLGKLQSGKYNWTARTTIDGTILEATGQFFVEKALIEQMNTTADHNLLRYISSVSGGQFFYLNDFSQIADQILNKTELNNIEYFLEKAEELISKKWLLILLVIFLTTEWAARKYFGSY